MFATSLCVIFCKSYMNITTISKNQDIVERPFIEKKSSSVVSLKKFLR